VINIRNKVAVYNTYRNAPIVITENGRIEDIEVLADVLLSDIKFITKKRPVVKICFTTANLI
jgi:hypothetical protein